MIVLSNGLNDWNTGFQLGVADRPLFHCWSRVTWALAVTGADRTAPARTAASASFFMADALEGVMAETDAGSAERWFMGLVSDGSGRTLRQRGMQRGCKR